MSILGSSNSAANKRLDVKNMTKWGYNDLIFFLKIVGKGEIARYEQFLLFSQCFKKMSVVDVSE